MSITPTNLDAVTKVAQRYVALDRRAKAAKADRDAAIAAAVSRATYDAVAKAAGLTKDRVNQIVREQRRYADR